MDRSVEFYFHNGLAPSTQKAYASGKNRYKKFCMKLNLKPLPATEHQLCQFVSMLADENICHSTIKCYLSAIRHLHVAEGVGDPHIHSMARLEQVLKGVKSTQARGGKQERRRLPITPDILLKVKQVWERGVIDKDKAMLWAAALTCFFGFLRAGEICVPSDKVFDKGAHLSPADVSVDDKHNPSVMCIRIKASKTDPFRQGCNVFMGKTGKALCPVAAMLAYLVVRQGGAEGPLFKFADGRPLTRERFVDNIRVALVAAGIDSAPYSGHSFRIGAATTAAKKGVGDATIKMLGRWKSAAYQLYVRTPRSQLATVSKTLVAD